MKAMEAISGVFSHVDNPDELPDGAALGVVEIGREAALVVISPMTSGGWMAVISYRSGDELDDGLIVGNAQGADPLVALRAALLEYGYHAFELELMARQISNGADDILNVIPEAQQEGE